MTPASTDLPPSGLIAGKYELIQLIGRGGMGSVWEGRHTTLGTRVAIKFIEAEYANSQDARSRFDNEARAAATIQSKHAIQIFDHGMTEDGRPYIVMEMLVGEPLDKRLGNTNRLTLQETVRIIHQVCRALYRAHEKGIVHRDLKPENIFLVREPDDDDDVAKVLDFGIAKIKTTPGATGISSSTKTGTLLGTPFYMSPEQARGLRNVDHRSDLWSLAVIVFRCVTGVLPFDGESLGDLLVKICTANVPVPTHVLPGLPPQLDAWMARALDREPDRRFQTAQDLADSLAYACGVSMRRGAAGTSTPEPAVYARGTSSPSHPHGSNPPPGMSASQARAAGLFQGSLQEKYGQPIPAATSAPLTASAPRQASSSKHVLLTVVGAALGLALGVFAVVHLVGHKPAVEPITSVQAAPVPTEVVPSARVADVPPVPPPPPTINVADIPAVPAATPPHGKKGPGKPPPGKTIPTPPAGGVVVAPPLPPPPPPPPPPQKSTPSTTDPGY